MGDINAIVKNVMASESGWAFIAQAMGTPQAGVTGIKVLSSGIAGVRSFSDIIMVEGVSFNYAGISTGRTVRMYVSTRDGVPAIQHGCTVYVTTDGVDTRHYAPLRIPVDLAGSATPFYITMGASELGDIAYFTAWGSYPLPIPVRETARPLDGTPQPVVLDGIKSLFVRG